MATKVKKPYDHGLNKEGKEAKDQKDVPKYELPVALDGVAAPIERRIGAWIIDSAICAAITYICLLAAANSDFGGIYRWFNLAAIVISAFWLYGMFPEYMPGQTIGRKLMRIYLRQVENSKPLGILKGFTRDYLYGFLGMLVTGPFELVQLLIQNFTKPETTEEKTLQMLPITKKELILVRDTIFKTETVYVPKQPKVKE